MHKMRIEKKEKKYVWVMNQWNNITRRKQVALIYPKKQCQRKKKNVISDEINKSTKKIFYLTISF